jgi:pyrimidine deaminase RibD-like protein
MATSQHTSVTKDEHETYIAYALNLAKLSPPRPTNFRVGALIVDEDTNTILSNGYTLELEGNTHAEQCAIQKLCDTLKCNVEALGDKLPPNTVLYTTLEPCSKRLSGNKPCVERILDIKRSNGKPGISAVYVGVLEPETFVQGNDGKQRLQSAGVKVQLITGHEAEILQVAKEGHVKEKP